MNRCSISAMVPSPDDVFVVTTIDGVLDHIRCIQEYSSALRNAHNFCLGPVVIKIYCLTMQEMREMGFLDQIELWRIRMILRQGMLEGTDYPARLAATNAMAELYMQGDIQ